MRDSNRIDSFLQELGELWKEKCPDWRFGQLMVNIFSETGDPFYFEEDKMLEAIKNYFRR